MIENIHQVLLMFYLSVPGCRKVLSQTEKERVREERLNFSNSLCEILKHKEVVQESCMGQAFSSNCK